MSNIDHRIELARKHFGCSIKPIEEFPGYFVGDDGSVFSTRTTKNLKRVSPTIASNGYPMVSIRHSNGKRMYVTVHKFVLSTFVGKPPDDNHEVRHLNGIRTDCRVENLAWGTHKENCADTIAHGRTTRGRKNSQRKLTESDVLAIRSMPGLAREVAEKFGVSRSCVDLIKRKKRWGWL